MKNKKVHTLQLNKQFISKTLDAKTVIGGVAPIEISERRTNCEYCQKQK